MKLQLLTALALLVFAVSANAETKSKSKSAPAPEKKYKTVDSGSNAEPFTGPIVHNKNNLYFGLGLNFFSKFGFHGRYAYRIDDKLLETEKFNNALYIEGGLAGTFYGSIEGSGTVTGFLVMAAARWDIQLNKYWIFFTEFGLGYNTVSGDKENQVKGANFQPMAGGGVIYNFENSPWSARVDVSWQLLGAGVMYTF